VKVVSATEPTEKPETPPTPTNPKRTTPIPSQRHTAETNNMTALKSAPEKPIPAPKPPQTVEAAKPIEMPSTPKTPQPVRPEFELRILRETSKDVVEEQEIEWEPDEDLSETLKAMRVDPREFKHEAVWLAASNLDEREFEKELIRSADRLVSRVEGLDPDGRDAFRLSLCKHLRDSVYEIKKLMRAPDLPGKIAKPATPKPEQAERIKPPHTEQDSPSAASLTRSQLNASSERPEPQKRLQTPQFVRSKTKPVDEKELQIEGYVKYVAVLRGEIEEKTVILVPINRSGLPSGVIASLIRVREGWNVVNVEEHVYKNLRMPLPENAILVATRPAYRSQLKKRLLPSPDQDNMLKLKRMLKDEANVSKIIAVITTVEMYQADEELRIILKRLGYKIKIAMFDEEAARIVLEEVMHPEHAKKLKRAAAILPWLAEKLKDGGWDGVKQYIAQLNIREKDKKELYETLFNATNEYPEYPNWCLAASLDVIENTEPKSKGHRRYMGSLDVNEKFGDLLGALWPTIAISAFICMLLAFLSDL
jgi:hypothetical protein